MFWFRHPKPFHRKEVAMQMASRKAAPPPSTTAITVEHRPVDTPMLQAGAVDPGGAASLHFSVRYRVGEYLAFVHEHVVGEISKGRFSPRRHMLLGLALSGVLALLAWGGHAAGWSWLLFCGGAGAALALAYALANFSPGLKFQIALFGTPMYLYKRYRMPECRFTIDAEKIERVSATGTLVRTWDDIVAVRTYSPGYLLILKRGALPIPSRCLSAAQAARLRVLVAAHRARLSVAPGARTRADTTPGNTAAA